MIATRIVLTLLLIFGAFAVGNSLNCSVCSSAISWDDCTKNAQVKTCTLAGVNAAHAVMVAYNPNLVQGTAQDEFSCFEFQANLKDPGPSELPVTFSRDCTFKKVDFCKGWLERVEVVKCETSGSGGLAAMGALVVAGFFAVYSRL